RPPGSPRPRARTRSWAPGRPGSDPTSEPAPTTFLTSVHQYALGAPDGGAEGRVPCARARPCLAHPWSRTGATVGATCSDQGGRSLSGPSDGLLAPRRRCIDCARSPTGGPRRTARVTEFYRNYLAVAVLI